MVCEQTSVRDTLPQEIYITSLLLIRPTKIHHTAMVEDKKLAGKHVQELDYCLLGPRVSAQKASTFPYSCEHFQNE